MAFRRRGYSRRRSRRAFPRRRVYARRIGYRM